MSDIPSLHLDQGYNNAYTLVMNISMVASNKLVLNRYMVASNKLVVNIYMVARNTRVL